MNSALQSVRSVEELTRYFLANEHMKELNTENPLGHNGQVAKAYGNFLHKLYVSTGSYAPRPFKDVIGRYAPSFSGYGQQDSQEFLGFLLDGLQEDLNRVGKKPYIEKPDSTDDMINDPQAMREMAAKVWDITKKRDDSVIADLFTGMYKSTLVCPECQKVSITFEPFNNLTLPLPIRNLCQRTVKYFPLNDVPINIDVELDKHATMKEMKDFISARIGVPPERLAGGEEFRYKFFKIYEDNMSVVDEISDNDHPHYYELEAVPTNVVVSKKPKKNKGYRSMLNPDDKDEEADRDDSMAERMLVPVLHRINPELKHKLRTASKSPDNITPPHFIILTPQEVLPAFSSPFQQQLTNLQ